MKFFLIFLGVLLGAIDVMAQVPTITPAGTLPALTSTYGSYFNSSAFTISGANMVTGITLTPPVGFELSSDIFGSGFAGSGTPITVGGSGTIAPTTIHVRLASTVPAGTYSGNIVATSTNAATVNIATAPSTVSPVPLAIYLPDKHKVYGSTLTGVTGSTDFIVQGLVNSETVGSVTISYATGPGSGNHPTDGVGIYPGAIPSALTGGTFTASNYNITYNNGYIVVEFGLLKITANNASKTYGSVLQAGAGSTAFTVTGLQNSETIGSATITYSNGNTRGNSATSSVGTYVGSVGVRNPVGGTFNENNYNIETYSGDIIVNPAPLTITADNKSKTYAQANPALTLSYSGFVNSETAANLGTAPSISTSVTASSPVGTYPISVSSAFASNYAISFVNGTFTVSKAPLTITVDNKLKLYQASNPALTVTYTGLVNNDTPANLTTQPTVSTTALTGSLPGNYPITASGAVSANYAISYVNGNMLVAGPPTNITFAQNTIFENQPPGVDAGSLSSESLDPNATFTYSLASGSGDDDNALFSISGNKVLTAAALNFEQKAIYSVLIRSTTQYGFFLDKQFSITINDVNEAPALAAISNQVICYTTASQNISLSGIGPGPESSQTTTITVGSSNSNFFNTLTVSQGSGGAGTLSYSIKPGVTGTATVTITVKDNGGTANGGNDTFVRTFTVTVNPLPVIAISSNLGTDISKGFTVVLSASGGVSYSWATAAGIISGQNTAVLTVRPAVTTTYTVTVTSSLGCTNVESITLNVLEDYKALNLSNILTPDNDGKNDFLVIKNLDMYPNNTIRIFDRAGKIIYTKKGYANDWNGTVQGAELSQDTYFYVVDFGQGIKPMKGYVSIIK